MTTKKKSDEDIEIESRTLAEQIARMQTESETKDGFTREDAIATLNDLIASAREVTGVNPMHPQVYCPLCDSGIEDCDCEPAGECLTCGTQCDDEGICPLCAALERAQERVREATEAAVTAGLRGAVPKAKQKALRDAYAAHAQALSAGIDGCRKCGTPLTLRDVVEGDACVDEGEDDEAGNVFVYCSEHCRETH
jgi:hypothetical protein